MNTAAPPRPLAPSSVRSPAATAPQGAPAPDGALRERLLERLRHAPGWEADASNVHVEGGLVVLQGIVRSDAARRAVRRAAEAVRGVQQVWDARVPMREWQSLG